MRFRCLSLLNAATCLVLCVICAHALAAPDSVRPHAGMLRYPDVSATHIVFVYANGLWIAPRAGGVASPVASPPGAAMFPKFSSDGKTLAFSANYDGNRDIYTIPMEGGLPFRVTHHPTAEMLCGWTPAGSLLFSAGGVSGINRSQQLFTVPASGGLPEMLPVPYGVDAAISPDGRYLAYTPNSRDFHTWKRYRGGMATDIWLFDLKEKKGKRITDWEGTDTLPMWHRDSVYYLSDGGPDHRLNIWRYDTGSGRRAQITHYSDYDVKFPSMGPGPAGGGEIVYQYGSGLYLLDLPTARAHAVEIRIPGDRPAIRPREVDFARYIAGWSISPSGKRAAVEARGDIWTAPAKNGSPRDLTRTNGAAERDPSWSPDGKWIAYFGDGTGEYELYVRPADGKGDSRQLTKGGKAFRYGPTWSPDSKRIAFSDKSGALYLTTVGSGETKLVDTDPWADRIGVEWSPDSRWFAYSRGEKSARIGAIWIYNVEKAETRRATSGMFSDSSPVFDRRGDYLYFTSSRSFRPTYDDYMGNWIYAGTEVLLAVPLRADMASPYLPKSDEEPAGADAEKGSKGGGAVGQWENEADHRVTRSPDHQITLSELAADDISGEWSGTASGSAIPGGGLSFKMTLKLGPDNKVTGTLEIEGGSGTVSGTYNPSTKELNVSVSTDSGVNIAVNATVSGDTITGTATAPDGSVIQLKAQRVGGSPAAGGNASKPEAKPESATAKAPVKVTIDFDGFEGRAIQLPVSPGRFGQLAVNDKNQLIYARFGVLGGDSGIKLFDISDEKKEEKTVAAGAGSFDISADGKKLLIPRGLSATIQDASPGATGDPVVTAGMMLTIDPREEWKQLLRDAWRIERDYFYDPNMHGVNWQAVYDQYAAMLPDCSSREDVGYVIGEMIAEMNVGHTYYGGGDVAPQPSVSVGMLGADLKLENGAYRIGRIYQGAPWDSDARGPLSQPGVKVKEGDYVLAVNGVPIDVKEDPWAAFQGMADRTVTLTVSAKPTIDRDSRDVPIRLVGGDGNLRYRAWIEQNRAYVDKKTGGRVGYIYVPNTGVDGQSDLVRQLRGQIGKDALIVDERWNGGGQIPDRFIELLNRPLTNYYARRDGSDWAWPSYANFGPKCMLINGMAGSGGDCFPWLFRNAKLGKLIGMRTWGGLVGISGNPGLIDGASITAPTFAFYKPDGTWGVEGHGVDPDIQVVDDPSLMVDGGDPQLDAAIAEMLDQLKRSPYVPAKRPPYPNRTGIGIPPKDR